MIFIPYSTEKTFDLKINFIEKDTLKLLWTPFIKDKKYKWNELLNKENGFIWKIKICMLKNSKSKYITTFFEGVSKELKSHTKVVIGANPLCWTVPSFVSGLTKVHLIGSIGLAFIKIFLLMSSIQLSLSAKDLSLISRRPWVQWIFWVTETIPKVSFVCDQHILSWCPLSR